jgi:hypothetical protein
MTFRALASGLAILFVACARDVQSPVVWHEEQGYRWRELSFDHEKRSGFTELSARDVGIGFVDSVAEDSMLANENLSYGSGVAIGDVDGDGRPDVFLARVGGPSALYKNLGGWKFKNIARESGVDLSNRRTMGATLVDIDGDGDLDLLVTVLGGPNGLFLNDDHGKFTEVTDAAALTSRRGSMTATLADVDGDGDLDLYIANYKVESVLDLYPPAERTYDKVVQRVGDSLRISPRFTEHYRLTARPDLRTLVRTERGEPDWFYLNDGHGRFTHLPFTGGKFLDTNGQRLREDPDWFALTARFFDANGDLSPDLYVCDDLDDPEEFWINDGKGTFRRAPPRSLRSTSNASMSIDVGDVDRDGRVDLFTVDMRSRDTRRFKTQTPTNAPLIKPPGVIDDRQAVQRNSLFLNRGDGTYAEISSAAGVDASDWSWSSLFLDVDLDGYEDLLIGTGNMWDVMDADTREMIGNLPADSRWHQELRLFPRLALHNVAFRNNHDLTFTEMAVRWGFASAPSITHGMALGDLDGDGDLDVVTNRLNASPGLFRNDAGAGRIAVRLRGREPNTESVGSKIEILAQNLSLQTKEVSVGGIYLSSSDPLYTFATGAADTVTVRVRWRYGATATLPGLHANREYEIAEPVRDSSTSARAVTRVTDTVRGLFRDVSTLLNHSHFETPYDDFARQALLPNKLSQLGPGVAWYDLNGDGSDDLIVGSGRGGRLTVFQNSGRRFRRVTIGDAAPADETAIVVVPGNSGTARLLVGQSNYEAPTRRGALALPSVVALQSKSALSWRQEPVVPGDSASVGPIAAADYNGDGRLDLFVGGRAMPGGYPAPTTSRLYLNAGAEFVLDTANESILNGIGMISAAVFSDVDGDGHSDLLLAPEWGYLRIFFNRGGRFIEAPPSYGLREYSSRWNGIATGDVNGDGRLDIVATTWGRNTKYHVTKSNPVYMYYGGVPIEAQRDSAIGGIVPVAGFSRISAALPLIRQRVRTFSQFATATIDQLLGGETKESRRLMMNTVDHMVFINRGDRFVATPLPFTAQLAPAFYAGIADFDGDGKEDIFLSQNFFPTDIETARYDAGLGLLLRGNGTGGFTPLSARDAGIAVYGDQRGAAFADFNGDGRLDIAVSQNGADTKLFQNAGAKPGLTVRLAGPTTNPFAIGASIRVLYSDGHLGPTREVQASTGYWSSNSPTQVMGLAGDPHAVWVRWPGGTTSEAAILKGQRTVRISFPGGHVHAR